MEGFAAAVGAWAATFLVERWPEILVGVMLIGAWRWWMGHKFQRQIDALKAERGSPLIMNIVSGDGRLAPEALRHALREELESHDFDKTRSLRDTVARLPQKPLGDGHTYAELPPGTNVVTLADGSIRLALPVRIAGTLSIGAPGMSAELRKRRNAGSPQ